MNLHLDNYNGHMRENANVEIPITVHLIKC